VRSRLRKGVHLPFVALLLLGGGDALRLGVADAAARAGAPNLALALDPASPSALERIARSRLREESREGFEGALAALERAAAAAPARAEIHRLRAEILGALGRETEADRAAERAFSLEPRRAAVARTAAERALRTDPALASARFRLANLGEPGRTDEGILLLFAHGATLRDLRGSVPDHAEARFAAGRAFLDLGMPGAAAEQLATAERVGKPAKRDRLLGRALLLLGDAERAEAAFLASVGAEGPEGVGAVVEAARESRDLETGIAILERIAERHGHASAALAAARLRREAGSLSSTKGSAP